MYNLPSYQDVLDGIDEKKEQQKELTKELDDQSKINQEKDYDNLFDYRIRHTFIIEFSQQEWNGLLDDMQTYYDTYGSYKSNNYRNVDVTYVGGDDVFKIEDVGIRSKGNIYSRYLPEDAFGNVIDIHYMMKFNETFNYDEESARYDELKTREVFNLEQLLFKRNNQNDPSYTNEVYGYSLFREAGVVVPNATFAEVRIVIEGKVEKVSLYNVFEHYDEEFIRKHFQEEPTKEVGDLYKGQWSATLDTITSSDDFGVRDWENNIRPLYSKETNKEIDSYDTLVDFSYGINRSNIKDRLAFLEANFDTDNFMRAMAVNVLLGNPDDYRGNGNNFYYYFDEDGFMTYVPFDYDNSMGNGWDGQPAFIDYTLGNDIYEWGRFDWNPFGIPLWDNLIEHEEYQILYENYLMEYIESGLFSEEAYLEIYDEVVALYGDQFDLYYDKERYINTKIDVIIEDVAYYRSIR